MTDDAKAQKLLREWYQANQRPLPWRENRDPYRIWISETMLQQTTTAAVIPFFERFIAKFPTLQVLAKAKPDHVMAAWAGLGYYSRARNLHSAAKSLSKLDQFPRTSTELLEYSGFGPYTARAVASIAFGENAGVVDGNVIRVFSRFYGQRWKWWEARARQALQQKSDQWAANDSNVMNQAIMELGRTICTAKGPRCQLCPLNFACQAWQTQRVDKLPLKKPRRKFEIWSWRPHVQVKSGRVLLVKQPDVPFLRDHWTLPGTARPLRQKPQQFAFKHVITHHEIYVLPTNKSAIPPSPHVRWAKLSEIKLSTPLALVHKTIDSHGRGDTFRLRQLSTKSRTTKNQRRTSTSRTRKRRSHN